MMASSLDTLQSSFRELPGYDGSMVLSVRGEVIALDGNISEDVITFLKIMQDSNGILKADQQLQTIKVQYQTHYYAITANASDQNVYVVKRRS